MMTMVRLQERLGECIDDLTELPTRGKKFQKELDRVEAIADVADKMIRNAGVIVSAKKATGELSSELVN